MSVNQLLKTFEIITCLLQYNTMILVSIIAKFHGKLERFSTVMTELQLETESFLARLCFLVISLTNCSLIVPLSRRSVGADLKGF